MKVTIFLCALAWTTLVTLAVAPDAGAQSATSLDGAFDAYCKSPGHSPWFCADRAGEMSASHKFDVIAAYCDTHKEAPFCGALIAPLTLEFDVATRGWRERRAGSFKALHRTVDFDPVTKLPTAYLRVGDVLSIDIRANPLVFLANRGEAKEENVAQVKALEQLLALFGSMASGLVSEVAKNAVDSDARRTRRLQILRNRTAPVDITADPIIDDEATFQADQQTIAGWTQSAQGAFTGLDGRLGRFKRVRADLQLVAQRLASTGSAQFDLARLEPALESPTDWAAEFSAVAAAITQLPDVSGCAPAFDGAVQLVSLNPADAVAVHAGALRFLQAVPTGAAVCPGLAYPDRLRDTIDRVREAAERAARAPDDAVARRALTEVHASARERHMVHALVLRRLTQGFGDLVGRMKEALTKEEDVRKAALVLARVAVRVKDAGVRTTGTTADLAYRLYVPDEPYRSPWTKARTNPVVVSVNSPYADAVPVDQKDVSTSYRVMRAGLDRLSFGVGLLFTHAASVSYAAVDPDPGSNTTTSETTVSGTSPPTTTVVVKPEAKKIVEKDRQPRTGAYGLFLNYRLWGSPRAGIGAQCGAATSADNPGFMAGISGNVSPYVTIGGGYASFRVKDLDMDRNAAVYSDADIRMRTYWDDTWYVSLSVNISDLPLFK